MTKTTCSKCGNELEPTRVHTQRYCMKCHAENMRKLRPKHSELSDLQKKKANARSYLNAYLKRGVVIKMPCEVCNDENSQAHHDDYDKPIDVRWFCRKHHLEHHKQLSNVP